MALLIDDRDIKQHNLRVDMQCLGRWFGHYVKTLPPQQRRRGNQGNRRAAI